MKLKLTILLSFGTFSLSSQNLHLGTNGNVGIGNTNPQNKLEITTNTPNLSGLRLSNLTSTSTTEKNNGKVLSVNQSGDVISTESLLNSSIIWSEQETNEELTALGYKLLGATTLNFSGINTNSIGIQWLKNTSNTASRGSHTAIWACNKMIIWGGQNGNGNPINSGASYDPSTDTWTSISTINAPSPRLDHSAIWTGSKMIIWGGIYSSTTYSNGGIYDPVTDSWTAISIQNCPSPRRVHTAIFTGDKMIIWGGSPDNGASPPLNSGGIYDVNLNTWSNTSLVNAPDARATYSCVWTGSKMIIWGGYGNLTSLNTGKIFDLQTNSWQNMTVTNAPVSRYFHQSVWTGNKMIVWGGSVIGSPYNINSGGIYDPLSDTWVTMNSQNAPSARINNTAVWTGNKFLVWAGTILVNGNFVPTNDGATYDILTSQWTSIQSTALPRQYHTSVWTGNQLIAFGGVTSTLGNTNGDILGIKYLSETSKRMFLFKKE